MENLKVWNYISLPWLIFTITFFVTFFLIAFLSEVDNSYLSKSYLNVIFFNTIFLSFGSAILSALIAVPLAILVTFYRFPGHKFFSWSLSLSIAFPAYVYAFIFVGIFEVAFRRKKRLWPTAGSFFVIDAKIRNAKTKSKTLVTLSVQHT